MMVGRGFQRANDLDCLAHIATMESVTLCAQMKY
jgi:hypothetical protein